MKTKQFNDRADVYTRVTDKIVADLEKGVRPWMKPWSADNANGKITRPLRHNGLPYQGINVLLLWAEAMDKGYSAPVWLTYRQAEELKGQVRKGEKGSLVVFANSITKKEEGEAGEETERQIRFMKGYTVFNVEQIDGLPEQYYGRPPPPETPAQRIDHAEQFVANTGANIQVGGNRAFYAIDPDYIRVPPVEAFHGSEPYYGTLLHELSHWTRHPSRLNRTFGRKAFGDEGYALEELCAELAATFLSADLGIEPDVREDHSAYIAEWLTVLKNDKTAIFKAAGFAQKAADYLHGLQP